MRPGGIPEPVTHDILENVLPAASLIEPLLSPPALPLNASLFLDFDGTLVDLVDRPDMVSASRRVQDIIARADRSLGGRFAIVTGREASFVRQQIGLTQLAIAGSHGQELHFRDGLSLIPSPSGALALAGDQLEVESRTRTGILIERKPLGVALHYRMAPAHENWCIERAGSLAREHGLHLQHGKMMIELRDHGAHKGDAIRQFMARAEFARTSPVFVGDDFTDEPAFEAAASFGGWGVLVGAARPTAAQFRLESVRQVLDWLEQELPA